MRQGADGDAPGCHGVRVRSEVDLGIGRCRGEPLADVEVQVGPVPPDASTLIWTLQGRGVEAASQRLYRDVDGHLTIWVNDAPQLALSADHRVITVDAPVGAVGAVGAVQAQLVASFGLPLVLDGLPVLILHGAAAARGDDAIVIVGPTGAGKSSALVGLVDAGWAAMSEDVCVIDLAASPPQVWPGPPWVRRLSGERGPATAGRRFRAGPKTAWDLTPWMATGPKTVAGIFVLDPPVGSEPRRTPLEHSAVLRALATHAVWLGDPAGRSRATFAGTAAAAVRIPAAAISFPRTPDWLDQLAAAVSAEASTTDARPATSG